MNQYTITIDRIDDRDGIFTFIYEINANNELDAKEFAIDLIKTKFNKYDSSNTKYDIK